MKNFKGLLILLVLIASFTGIKSATLDLDQNPTTIAADFDVGEVENVAVFSFQETMAFSNSGCDIRYCLSLGKEDNFETKTFKPADIPLPQLLNYRAREKV